jgi:hypothetical protein
MCSVSGTHTQEVRSASGTHKPEQVLEDQVQQPHRYGGDHAPPLSIINHRWSTAGAAF